MDSKNNTTVESCAFSSLDQLLTEASTHADAISCSKVVPVQWAMLPSVGTWFVYSRSLHGSSPQATMDLKENTIVESCAFPLLDKLFAEASTHADPIVCSKMVPVQWATLPSVGTWFVCSLSMHGAYSQDVPCSVPRMSATARDTPLAVRCGAAKIPTDSMVSVSWSMLPSVGTWLVHHRPEQKASLEDVRSFALPVSIATSDTQPAAVEPCDGEENPMAAAPSTSTAIVPRTSEELPNSCESMATTTQPRAHSGKRCMHRPTVATRPGRVGKLSPERSTSPFDVMRSARSVSPRTHDFMVPARPKTTALHTRCCTPQRAKSPMPITSVNPLVVAAKQFSAAPLHVHASEPALKSSCAEADIKPGRRIPTPLVKTEKAKTKPLSTEALILREMEVKRLEVKALRQKNTRGFEKIKILSEKRTANIE